MDIKAFGKHLIKYILCLFRDMHEDRTPSYTEIVSILAISTEGAIGETPLCPNKLWESPPLTRIFILSPQKKIAPKNFYEQFNVMLRT